LKDNKIENKLKITKASELSIELYNRMHVILSDQMLKVLNFQKIYQYTSDDIEKYDRLIRETKLNYKELKDKMK